MSLPVPVLRRLAFVKLLFRSGLEQGRRPPPLSVAALLTLHDAAELFLHLACEHHQVEPRDKAFMAYFPALDAVATVSQKPGMERLNKARVALKHHGNLPHDDDLESFRHTVMAFFEENTPVLFGGVRFASISLVDAITSETARAHLAEAEDHWESGRAGEARNALALAYDALRSDYRKRNRDPRSGRNPVDLGPSFEFMRGLRSQFTGDARRVVDAVVASITQMRTVLEVMVVGIDYKKHVEFKMLTPGVVHTSAGTSHFILRHARDLSQDEYDRCFNFVIDAALKLQEFEFWFGEVRAGGGVGEVDTK